MKYVEVAEFRLSIRHCLKSAVAGSFVVLISACGIFSDDATDDSAFQRAVWSGDLDTVKEMVAEGADVNARDAEGNPLLLEAVWRNHLEVAQVLVDAGADVNARER